MPLTLVRAVAAVTMQGRSETAPPPAKRPSCEWSEEWTHLPYPPTSHDAKVTPPRIKKGRIDRPRSTERREIEGQWVVQLVIDREGHVRDAAFVKRPRVEPPWPELEDIITKSVRKFRYEPARVDGVPVSLCLTVSLHQKWHYWE
jgi:outer membrane biosynthesis protein TonB